jgi:hypothetical protein
MHCRLLALLALVVAMGWASQAEAASLSKVLQIPGTATEEEATDIVRTASDDILQQVLGALDTGAGGAGSSTGGHSGGHTGGGSGGCGTPSYGHCGQPMYSGCNQPRGNQMSCGGGGAGMVININITINIVFNGNFGSGHASPSRCYGF